MTDEELSGIITDRGALIFPAVTIENQGTVQPKFQTRHSKPNLTALELGCFRTESEG